MKLLNIQFPEAAKDLRIKYNSTHPTEYEAVFKFPTENITDFSTNGNYSFSSVEDGDPVIASFRNFTVNAGHTVTVSQRCKGLYLNILGDLTIKGTLTMTARGCVAEGKYVSVYDDRVFYCISEDVYARKEALVVIHPVGGLGIVNGNSPGVNGACGSGGGAVMDQRGGHGTSFSGGAGAGGPLVSGGKAYFGYSFYGGYYPAAPDLTPSDIGGRGGPGSTAWASGYYTACSGSGAGNPGGWSDQYVGATGTGRLLILLVQGNVNITGVIQSNGSAGSSDWLQGRDGPTRYRGCGSGGGAIHLFHKGTIAGAEKVTAVGGSGYKSGGTGTVNIKKI